MSYGFDLGRLKSTSTGLSYVDTFAYPGGTVTKTYAAPGFEFATDAKAFVMPAVNVPASTVPAFPVVTATVSSASRSITVVATGGNTASNILVFVR